MLVDFELTTPATLDEALAEIGSGIVPLAGGTNLLVDMRARRETPDRLIWLGGIGSLRQIRIEKDHVTVGSGTTLGVILNHPAMAESAPSLMAAARAFGGQMVRNRATLAGNICSGSPAADTVPPLLSLDAEICLASTAGTRIIPLNEFYPDYKQTARRADELVTAIRWKMPPPNAVNLFYKLGLRKGDAITVAGVAVTITGKRSECTGARIALGAVAPVIKRAQRAENMLVGEALTPTLIDAAARQAAEECNPIDDLRASADYRRHAVHMLTRRLVTQAWDQIG